MIVETKWFGTIEVGDEKIITFDKGIMGFENHKKFTIVYNSEKEDAKTIMWLQSLDEKNLALPVMAPEIVYPQYDPIVEDELLKSIGDDIQNADLVVLVTVTVPQDLTKMTCNLKAPIIINVDTLKGCQLIADNDEYVVKYPIYDIVKAASEKGGE
ncbi:MAG: flagellar assembly protein FliW [Bacteroides sp.]|nr:flagellar assembly protein FliW [Clostridia bacterium]